MKTRQYAQNPTQDMSGVSAKKLLQTRSFQAGRRQRQPISQGQQDFESMTRGFDLTNAESFAAVGGSAVALSQPLQAKLTIGAPNDKYEQEADRVARDVIQRMNAPQSTTTPNTLNPSGNHPLQRHKLEEDEEESLQAKRSASLVQRSQLGVERHLQSNSVWLKANHSSQPGFIQAEFESDLNAARNGGAPLDPTFRAKIEPAMGADFSQVKVHTDSTAAQLNQSIQAKAFTTGQDIFFKQGEYNPKSRGGQELLAHELTHVIQQNGDSVQRHLDHQDDDLHLLSGIQQDQAEELKKSSNIQRQIATSACSGGCQCTACTSSTLQRQADVSQPGSLLSVNILDRVQRQNLQIQRHAENKSGRHGLGCGCSTCITSNAQIQRKPDMKHDASCPCPKCSNKGSKIQAKFAAHSSLSTTVQRYAITPSSQANLIQRHSSWEHQLLGDAEPTDLAKIGAWQDLIEQTKKEGTLGFRTRKTKKAEVDIDGVGKITKGNVMHVIAQELQRLDTWQSNPPQQGSSGDIDKTFQTVLVAIPGGGKDGKSPLIITYGELNTLADYYGSLDVMKTADPKERWEVIQSVRKETFLRLSDIYKKLKDSLTSVEKKDQDYQASKKMMKNNKTENIYFNRNKFEDANEADFISSTAGQLTLLAFGAGAKKENEYSATLARNACHFAPESWHAWSSYHQKARKHAENSWDKMQEAEKAISNYQFLEDNPKVKPQTPKEFIRQEKEKAETKIIPEAKEEANEAILNNGFGDHYLQDSYAAGHMINKTLIMQWFVQWLDTQKWTMDFAKDESWRKVQAIAYKQPELASLMQYDKSKIQGYDTTQTQNRAKNPQAVEDIGGDDWKVRFDALGLQVPTSLKTPGTPPRNLMEWWQNQAGKSSKNQELSGKDLLSDSGQDFKTLKLALKALISDGVVYFESWSADKTGREILSGKKDFNTDIDQKNFKGWKFVLRKQYIPKDLQKFTKALKKSNEKNDDSQYQRMAAAVTYQDYMAFMNNAYVQKSTNALHDIFCKNGLDVSSGSGESLFKVYGDDSMFNKESAKGVKHSGETAKMSRDAIRNIITDGDDKGLTTKSILDRLPSRVKPEGSTEVSIEEWHDPSKVGGLRTYCEQTVFPGMGAIDKIAGASGDLSKFISKDKAKVHGSEAF